MVQLKRRWPIEWPIRWPIRWLTLAACVLLAPLLSGCVDYSIGIQFNHQSQGTLTQTLQFSEPLLALNRESAEPIFQAFAQSAKALSGKVRRPSENSLQITLPFNNAAQLLHQFNAFYSGEQTGDRDALSQQASLLSSLPGAPIVSARLGLAQRNFVFALRNRLTYDLVIGAPSGQSDALLQRQTDPLQLDPLQPDPLQPDSTQTNRQPVFNNGWLKLSFQLTTPWRLSRASDSALTQDPPQGGHTTSWQLALDESQHIEAVFWVLNPVGIGAGAIALLCTLGYRIKYKKPSRKAN